jgi:succinate dehydrogenase/fumarate reductase flavoprotein subunit
MTTPFVVGCNSQLVEKMAKLGGNSAKASSGINALNPAGKAAEL